ncbi:bifunctional DNA-formamidopyrimidine glycosylase/DNA-(apurinic or apyrimidinic site) lyase [Georgenia subflava]|uniref:Formamidopyrimidine-DNA glycosylase n=1 Tax=Georgenia subflava TaxID=1622177 RepID=A0A6N7EHV9_9MICO|nr:bifunctional DNA-formamidopyrimidine glycosylase/DNA-(apurinic or apyrimidinic site) lyase [Georgenia subflava]MPV36225.1 bifunctional DNA-formamidopyrimidine glycosylase/DNA-(apurinic or apyrimidinic site) lyase [Georgenia subflava]
MPELPEVETVRAGLARRVLGRTVAEVEVRHPRATRRQPGGAAELAARLRGRTFTAAVRRGKYLWLTVGEDDDGRSQTPPSEALLAHLGMSGQMLVQEPEGARRAESETVAVGEHLAPAGERHLDLTATLPPTLVRDVPATTAHLRVRLAFTDGGELWFVDQRTFGHLMAVDTVPTGDGAPGGYGSDAAVLPEPVAHIARDLLDPALDRADLVRRTRARRTEVKRALLDQSLVSGVGNIYADEALWRARLHGTRRTDLLRPAQLRDLFDAATEVMTEALAAGGTSFDALYVDVDGAAGYFARSLAVYGRVGRPCPRCGATLRREEFMNRSSFSCPRCQRRPPVRA